MTPYSMIGLIVGVLMKNDKAYASQPVMDRVAYVVYISKKNVPAEFNSVV